MQLTPYRRPAPRADLPSRHASCTDDEAPDPCDLARPRPLFAHPRWRWVWLGLSAFASSAITAVTLAAVIPNGGIDAGERAFRPRPHVAHVRMQPVPGSVLIGAVHDADALFAYAQAAKREGNDVTLVDAWVSTNTELTSFDDALGISSRDAVLSIDGYAVPSERHSAPFDLDLAYRRHVIELRRDGRLVVISVRRSG